MTDFSPLLLVGVVPVLTALGLLFFCQRKRVSREAPEAKTVEDEQEEIDDEPSLQPSEDEGATEEKATAVEQHVVEAKATEGEQEKIDDEPSPQPSEDEGATAEKATAVEQHVVEAKTVEHEQEEIDDEPSPQPSEDEGATKEKTTSVEQHVVEDRSALKAERDAEKERRVRSDTELKQVQDLLLESTSAQGALEKERDAERAWRIRAEHRLHEVEELLRESQVKVALLRTAEESARGANMKLQSQLTRAVLPLVHFGANAEVRTPTNAASGLRIISLSASHSFESTFLESQWRVGGRAGAPNPYQLLRIEAVDNGPAMGSFLQKVQQFEDRRASGADIFNPDLEVFDPDGEKQAVLDSFLKPRFLRTEGLQKTNIMLAFHGVRSIIDADSICAGGFAAVCSRDNQYFGKGNYATTYAQYACEYSTGAIDGGSDDMRKANDQNEFVVLACWVAPGMVYPISRAADYEEGANYSKYYQEAPLPAAALKPRFNAHFVGIARGEWQCKDGVRFGKKPDYDELVVEESQQIIAAYRLFFTVPQQS